MILQRPLAGDDPDRSARVSVIVVSTIVLLICTNGPSTYVLLHVLDQRGGAHSWVMLYPFMVAAVIGIVALTQRLRSNPPRNLPFAFFAVAAYVIWALASTAWSVSSWTTAKNASIGVGVAAFGIWFGWFLTLKEQIWSVMLACSTAVVASATVIAFLPQYGKAYPDKVPNSSWRGIFGNRNSLAPICALGLIALVGFVMMHPCPRRVIGSVFLAVVHLALLRGSGGATALAALGLAGVVAAFVPGVWLFKRTGARGSVVGIATALGAGAASIWLLANMGRLASWMARDATLNGRRPIWRDVRGFIQDKPIRGYGFWAFWDRTDLTAASYTRLDSAYGSAHNSVLEVMLGLGVIGLVFYLAVVLSAILGVAILVWVRPSIAAWWWAAVLAFLVVQNLMESFVLWHSYIWVLFIASAFALYGSEMATRRVDGDRTEAPVG